MPLVQCLSCGQYQGKREWLKSTQSTEKCDICRKEETERVKELALIEKQKALALKDKDLAIEKEKRAQKEKDLAIEKEKGAQKEKELAIEKEKAVEFKKIEVASNEKKEAEKREHEKWLLDNQRIKDEESDKRKLVEIEARKNAQIEVEKTKEKNLTIIAGIESKRFEAEKERMKFLQQMTPTGQTVDMQSLLSSILLPSTNFQPLSNGDSSSSDDKESPSAYANENIEDSH